MKRLPTSTQPEVAKSAIYGGGRKPTPIRGASNQPTPLPHTKVHGVKKTRTIRVRLKASKDRRVLIIPFADFNPAIHRAVE